MSLVRESTLEQNNSHRPTCSTVREPELYPPALSRKQVTGIANSISGTARVGHVLERCCEVMGEWRGVTETVVLSAVLPGRAGANIISVRICPLTEGWVSLLKRKTNSSFPHNINP